MQIFLNAVETIVFMFALIFTGWILSHIGWLKEENKEFLTKLVVGVSVPALVVNNFFTSFDRDLLASSLGLVLIAGLSILIILAISLGLASLLKLEADRKAPFVTMSAVSNSIFFGLPVCLGLFGDSSLPFILFYYLANTIIFWAICAPMIMASKDKETKRGTNLKKILNPPLITILISALLLYINFSPPRLVLKIADSLSSFVTPLASLVIGRVIYEMDLKKLKIDLSTGLVLVFRFILAPGLMHLTGKGLGMGGLALQVFTIQAAMPVMTQALLVTELAQADSEYVATNIFLSTILSLVFIPLYMVLMQ